MDHSPPGSPEYLGGWLSDRLAEEESELGITCRVAGDVVFLGGVVSTEERRVLVGDRAAELVPGYRVCNEVTVASYDAPVAQESLA